jgi:Bacterial SH3 domain/Peptidase family M23
MPDIAKSVGRHAVNEGNDVRIVRSLLNQCRHLLVPLGDLPDGTDLDEELIARIETFQRRVVTDVATTDGRVDPGGTTLRKLNENSRGLPQSIPLFPLHERPRESFESGGRQFRFSRDGGARIHAACDLIAPVGTPVRAMEDGRTIRPPRTFFQDTISLEVDHGGFVARYAEMSHTAPGLDRAGAAVSRGQTIGFVGRLNSGRSMLHLELYAGTETGDLSTRRPPFRRRADLLDPTDFLKIASFDVDDTRPVPIPDAAVARVSPRITGSLNVRARADTDSNVLASLGAGDRLRILEQVEGGDYTVSGRTRKDWLKVDADGREGFVAAFYVDAGSQTGRVSDRVQTALRLRSAPQDASQVLAKLSRGSRFTVAERLEGDAYDAEGTQRTDWLAVEHNGIRGFVAAFYVDLVGEDDGGGGSPAGANAVLFTFEPRGASDRTARQDGLRGGVSASETMAATDRARVMRFKQLFVVAASENGLPPALLAAIASRESRGGSALDEDGLGDNGHGYGLMQIDDRSFRADTSDGPFGQAHISQASDIFKAKLSRVEDAFPSLADSAQLQTAISRYNGGRGLAAPDSDTGTTGGDYSNDVWARARFYAREEDWT